MMLDIASDCAIVATRVLEGDHPIAAWRHVRGIGCEALAVRTSIDLPRVYALDRELEMPTLAEIARLAAALDAPRDMLTARQGDSDELGGGGFAA